MVYNRVSGVLNQLQLYDCFNQLTAVLGKNSTLRLCAGPYR